LHRNWYVRALALGATAALLLGACGGDDDDDAADTTETTAASGDATDPAAFCSDMIDVGAALTESEDGGGPAVEAAISAARESAPDEVAESLGTMAEAGASEQEPGPEFFEASVNVSDFMADNCGFTNVDVTAKNYEFQGIPETVDAGAALFRLSNGGTEWHEMTLFKINEGEQRPLDELLALPEEEAQALATPVGGAFAPPEAGDFAAVDLEPGRYAAVCFIPVGATPDVIEGGQEPDGAPHFTEGMAHEFEVV
jgi:hypothetical protein